MSPQLRIANGQNRSISRAVGINRGPHRHGHGSGRRNRNQGAVDRDGLEPDHRIDLETRARGTQAGGHEAVAAQIDGIEGVAGQPVQRLEGVKAQFGRIGQEQVIDRHQTGLDVEVHGRAVAVEAQGILLGRPAPGRQPVVERKIGGRVERGHSRNQQPRPGLGDGFADADGKRLTVTAKKCKRFKGLVCEV